MKIDPIFLVDLIRIDIFQIYKQSIGNHWYSISNPTNTFRIDKSKTQQLIIQLSLKMISTTCTCNNNLSDIAKQIGAIKGGKGFLQFGNWRIGVYDKLHFVFCHKSGYTSVIYRSDGTVHNGPRKDYNLWQRQGGQISNIKFLNKCIEFDQVWSLCEIDHCHLSLGSLNAKTSIIWRVDGTKHEGPRSDYNGFSKNVEGKNIKFGDKFVEIGYWRIGQNDENHMSIGTQTLVSQIYRSDGTIHNGPRMDYRIQREVKLTLQ